jgi:formylglycine-generating enzyme required for sulfatase activity
MQSVSSCPAPEELARLFGGDVSGDAAERLEQHLTGCPGCTAAAGRLLVGDTLLDSVRRAGTLPGVEADEPRVERLIARLTTHRPPGGPDTGGGPARPPADAVADLLAVLAPAERPDELGRLGSYRILEVLGVGGMGIVLRAEDPQLRRVVALKVLKPVLAAGQAARQRFRREAQATAALEHDHVVAVYQVGEDRGLPFLAMQLLHGESLAQRLEREGRLPAAEVARIGREVAEGLAAAHARGLIHRDIKPSNIWLETGSGRVKVLDFGLARVAEDTVTLTQTGTIVGTPAYMAPEQARGEAVDARSDLFSLGCVLYQLTTGELPFHGPNVTAILHALAVNRPRPPHEINPEVPPALSDLVMCLLAKDPTGRPPSAQAVSAALRASPAAAPPPRSPAGWAVRFGLAAVLLVALGLGAYQYGAAIVRVVTNKGVLVIETDDKAVELTVKGQSATIIDHRTKREIEVGAGDQEIEVRERPDGLHFFTKRFTLSRGGTEIVHVREEMARSGAAGRAAPRPPAEGVANSLGMKLKLIKPGKFLMGSPKDEEGRRSNEGPQHEVEITKPFYMGECPVTKGQFAAFVKDAGYKTEEGEADGKGGWGYNFAAHRYEQKPEYTWRHPGFPQTDEHPVVQVSWNDARAFCAWLSKKEGRTYDLPTEAEWEYACRAGTTTRYWCGDADASVQGNANCADASLKERLGADVVWFYANWNDGYPYTSPVGAFKANPWGLYDMGGNVSQWCADWYGPYPGGAIKDPTGPENGVYHVLHGGSWGNCLARSAVRGGGGSGGDIGFRVVLRPGAAVSAP